MSTQETKPMAELAAEYAASKRTGCLEVQYGLLRGEIYLQFGQVIQAEFEGKKGPPALFELLQLDSARLLWHEGLTPMYVSMTMDFADVVKLLAKPMANGSNGPNGHDACHVENGRPPDTAPILPAIPHNRHVRAGVFAELEESNSRYTEKYMIELSWINCPYAVPIHYILEDTHQACYLAGRLPTCQIWVEDESVESVHCCLLVHENLVEVWDLGTDHRTALNGRVIERATLDVDDILTLGSVDLKFGLLLRRNPADHANGTTPEESHANGASELANEEAPARRTIKYRSLGLPRHALRGFFARMFNQHGSGSVLNRRHVKAVGGSPPEAPP